MAHITEDRILESSTTTGTGAFTLAGAVTGFRTFASVMAVNDTCWYAIWGVDGQGTPTGQFESGLGTYSATNTLTRTTILESSSAGAAVTFSAGTKYVAITLTANKTAQFDNVNAMFMPVAETEPEIPTAGNYLYAKEIIPGQTSLKMKRPSGVDSPLQDGVAFNRVQKLQGGPLAIATVGVGTMVASTAGTAVAGTAGTNIRNHLTRTQYATASTSNALNSLRSDGTTGFSTLRGSIAGEGGFRYVVRFTLGAVSASNRVFVGLRDVTTVPTNVNPFTSTTPGGIGIVANAATSANWRIAHNVSGTTPTTIDLGANFPVNATDLIELALFCRPFLTTVGDVGYRVRRYTNSGTDAAFESTGTLTGANLPTGATFLYPSLWMVNVAAQIVNFQVISLTLESDW